jgi:hypothetical protein
LGQGTIQALKRVLPVSIHEFIVRLSREIGTFPLLVDTPKS